MRKPTMIEVTTHNVEGDERTVFVAISKIETVEWYNKGSAISLGKTTIYADEPVEKVLAMMQRT